MISIKVPPLGESIVEATISRWTKKEGDSVASGETLVELETDKVTVEVPALKAGVLARRLKSEGDVVKVDEVLGELDETAVAATAPASATIPPRAPVAASIPAPSVAAPAAAIPAPSVAAPAPPPLAPAAPPAPPVAAPAPAPTRVSPAAQRLAQESGLDLADITGTGRGGVVSKPDVIEHVARGQAPAPVPAPPPVVPPSVVPPAVARPAVTPVAAAPAAAAPAPPNGAREVREKMSTRRKRIAEHLLEAQHATAHLTTFNEIDMSAVESLRARIRERIEKEHGVKLSMMPFFVRAACMALKQYPVVNARVDGDHIVYHQYVNMGIAVASEAGLVVPNIKDADRMGMIDVAKAISAVARKARDGKLTMDDLTGGTFTITNGGVFGSLISTPIINFPQVGILGLHKLEDRAVVVNGQVVVRPMMYVALSYDHRIIDGQQAVLFLVRLKELMEDPGLMAVD
jgi:2-oxoglutarate dehydrogenase E2 component (dihydrolipoamide succinyltransferase)